MKKNIIFPLAVLMFVACASQALSARNYYLAASGNDANNGTSSITPWQTLTKLAAQTLAAGDTVFLRRGDTFRGTFTVNQAGTAAQPIVFSAYGTGANPILSGAEQVTNWTLNGANYQATVSQAVSNFFINHKEQIIARYPNEGQYLFLDSASKRTITDRDLARVSSSFITGSKLCIHTAQWCWELETVGAYANNVITFTDSTELDALNGFGYFLYDNINHMDTAKEWKYDAASKILSYRAASGVNPNTAIAEATVYSSGLRMGASAQNIVIENITFEKQYAAGVELSNTSRNIKISRCAFNRQFLNGVDLRGSKNTVEYCSFTEVDGLAVAKNAGTSDVIHHNTFRSIGQFRNSGVGRQYNLTAIHLGFTDSSHVHHNVIDSAGYCGISTDGKYNLIERNVVSNAMLLNNDGAALKSFGGQAAYNIFRNNFVAFSDGNTEGTRNGEFLTPGIYFDFLVSNSTIHENTIYNHKSKGIFQNAGNQNNTITNNIVFGSDYCLDLNGTQAQNRPISGEIVKNNVFIAYNAASYLVKQSDYTNMFRQGVVDSNFYLHPFSTSRFALRYENNQPRDYTFAAWQAAGNDQNSRYNAVQAASGSGNTPRLFMNQTDTAQTSNLKDTLFLDMSGNQVCGSVTLQPYTSRVLIQTPQKCTPTGITSVRANTETVFTVAPNPASDVVTVHFTLTKSERVSLKVFTALGREVAQILDSEFARGEHSAQFNTRDASVGTIFLRLQTPTFSTTKVVQVLR